MSRTRKYDYSYPGETSSIKDLSNKVEEIEEGGGSGGTSDYNKLTNKPKISGEELVGDKTPEELKLIDSGSSISADRIDEICQI